MRSGIAAFKAGISEKLVLKIGIHKGHSNAVTLNERLDYFGQSVNLASRIQNQAGADEINLSGDVYDSLGVAGALASCTVTPEQAIMKGISGEICVYRVHAAYDQWVRQHTKKHPPAPTFMRTSAIQHPLLRLFVYLCSAINLARLAM